MEGSHFNKKIQNGFVIALAVILTILFLWMIRSFLLTILLAMITAGLFHGAYKKFLSLLKGKKALASGLTVLLITLLIVVPLGLFITVVVEQANEITSDIVPKIQEELENDQGKFIVPEWVPYRDYVVQNQNDIVKKINEASGKLGDLVINGVANFTQGALGMFLKLFVFLYTLFFLLMSSREVIEKVRHFVPIDNEDFDEMLTHGLSVTRATLKGALLIGALQGSLVGLMFLILGIQGAAFWGAVSIVLSIIPSIGSGVVWIPAVIILFAQGETTSAIILLVWGAVVVGLIDNFLRPRLIGRDAKMSDVMILLSTLGGLTFFGITGFILGPVLAGLVQTIWNIYDERVIQNGVQN